MRSVTLALVVALGMFGCNAPGEDPADDLQAEVTDTAGKEDAVSRPVGTYLKDAPQAGEFVRLVLKTDKTFHRETMIYCFMAPCNPIVHEGTYVFTKSGSTRYIRFLDADGNLIDRYAYKMAGDILKLRLVGTSTWVEYERASISESWCGVPEDCELQNLPQPRCPGEWTCSDENTCAYRCGNPCELAGGTCVALTPNACADGEIGDASVYSCGGMLGVACCLPKPECPRIAQPAPSFCPDGTIVPVYGDINGLTCITSYQCQKPEDCAPECRAIGSRSEGWYDSCTGQLICWTKCEGKTAYCGAIGSRSEGWYTTDGAGCMGMNLIHWDNCAE